MNFEFTYPFLNQANDSNDPELLDRLAQHPNFRVRVAVASNESTSGSTLALLYSDRMWMVAVSVIRNRNVPRNIVDAALLHRNPIMVGFALSNSQVSADEVMQAVQNIEFDRASKRDICLNLNLSDEQRQEIQGGRG